VYQQAYKLSMPSLCHIVPCTPVIALRNPCLSYRQIMEKKNLALTM